jgi:hypothetical protein
VKHEPNHLAFVQADFDKVVSRSERSKVVYMISAIQLRVLRQDGVVSGLQTSPCLLAVSGNFVPRTSISRPAVIGTAMRNGLLDRFANAMQIIRQITSIQ